MDQHSVWTLQAESKQTFLWSKLEDVQTGPSSERLSKAHTPVEPNVAQSWRETISQLRRDKVALFLTGIRLLAQQIVTHF